MSADDFSKFLALERCRIEKYPHYVFLCGGAIATGNQSKLVRSARDAFLHHKIKENGSSLWDRLVLAEDIFNKFPEEEYKDLLTFEQDLAELSSLIVIFLESPGSFAELGSFVAMQQVRRKVAVVIADKYARNKSFVWKGPIAHLENHDSDLAHRVYTYPWNPDAEASPPETFFEDAESLVDQLETCLNEVKVESIIDLNNDLHQMLLMIQFLNISRIASVTDVVHFFRNLNAPEEVCKVDRLKGRLALLVCLNLIAEKQYGHHKFFIGHSKDRWVSFGYRNESHVRDESRWVSLFAEERLLPANKQKMLALKSWMKINEKKDELQPN